MTKASSVKELQASALASAKAGGGRSLLEGLGKEGKNQQNVERDLHSRMRKAVGIKMKPHRFQVPARVKGETRLVWTAIVHPHLLFAHLYTYDREL